MESISFIELNTTTVVVLFLVGIREPFGATGTNLYVSFVFVVVLGIVGTIVLRDGMREKRGEATADEGPRQITPLVRWVRGLHIPGTMIHFKSIDAKVSFLVIAPLGFATGLLAATIAVGGFIGVPAMMYVLGLPALMASATELVVAFVMGLGGSFFYALDGFVDIRLSMIILAGLFGIQIGAIGTTYVKDHVVKFVMAAIMLLVLVSRFFYIPGYLVELGYLEGLTQATIGVLDRIGEGTLAFALLFGAVMILFVLYKGMREHRLAVAAAGARLSPLGRFERFVVASDGSEFSAAAVREAVSMARKCGAHPQRNTVRGAGGQRDVMPPVRGRRHLPALPPLPASALSSVGPPAAAEQPRVALDEGADPRLHEGPLPALHVPPAENADRQGAEGIDEEIPHGVGQAGGIVEHRLLHPRSEQLIHRELEDLPENADRDGEQKREQRDEARAQVQIDALVLVEDVDQQKSANREQQPGRGMQRHVPPPDAFVVAAYLAEEQRREHEYHRQHLKLGRHVHPEAAPECVRQQRHDHDRQHQESGHPLAVIEQQGELHCHDELQQRHHTQADPCRQIDRRRAAHA